MMSKPNVRDLIVAVRQLAVEHPNNKYLKADPKNPNARGNCSYTLGKCTDDKEDDEEGCIFGRGFRRIGFVLPKEPQLYDGNDNDRVGISAIIGKFFTHSNTTEILWCRAVQDGQDREKPWAECIVTANNLYPSI